MNYGKAPKQFIYYNFAAISSAVSDFTTFTILVYFGLYMLSCQAISRIIGGIVSFSINKHYSFSGHGRSTIIEIRRFLLLYGVSYSLSLFLLFLFHEGFGIPIFYSKVMSDGSCFIFNFIIMKTYVYAKGRSITKGVRTFIFRRGL